MKRPFGLFDGAPPPRGTKAATLSGATTLRLQQPRDEVRNRLATHYGATIYGQTGRNVAGGHRLFEFLSVQHLLVT
jgi:hypothetical protein